MKKRARFHTLGSLIENTKHPFSRLAILVVGTINASSLALMSKIRSHGRLEELKDKLTSDRSTDNQRRRRSST